MNKLARVLLLFASILSFTLPAAAQEAGRLTGTVVDGDLGGPLPGANVLIVGTGIGTTTDLNGSYALHDIAPGTYSVSFSFVGFAKKTIEGVEIEPGKAAKVEVTLMPQSYGLDEVTVEARLIRNNEAALLADRQKASAVSDAISAEAISKSGAGDAAGAMKNVTGASVVGGKYVYVRGLGNRYSNTQLNGVELPSSDPDKNSVQFDLFPSNLLENIVTLKTFTPDRPGNFTGGLVDIGTKSFPDDLSAKISASGTWNSETQLADYLTVPGQDLTFWGNGSDFAMPEVLANADDIPQRRPTSGESFDPEVADRYRIFSENTFAGNFAPLPGAAPSNQSYSASLGNQMGLFGNRLGYVASVKYSRSADGYSDGLTQRYSVAGDALAPNLRLQDTKSEASATFSGLANATYLIGGNHEVGINTLYTHTAETLARYQSGGWPEEFGANDSTSFFTTRTLQFTERALRSGQLRGKHYLSGLLGMTAEWTLARALTLQDQPDVRFFANTERTIGGNKVYSVAAAGFREPTRLYRNLEETKDNAKLDLSIPFTSWTGTSAKVKLGGLYQYTDRSFDERNFLISPASPTEVAYQGDPQAYFAPENFGVIGADTLAGGALVRHTYGHLVLDQTRPSNNYDGSTEITAGYAMIDMPLTRSLRLVGGARVEATNQRVVSQALADTTTDASGMARDAYVIEDGTAYVGGEIEQVDVLPSLNLVWKLKDNMNLRGAVTRTLARPSFREFAPFASFDFIGGELINGNPDLDRTLATNYDFRWEWFTRPGELIAASVFYKDLDNPIERAIVTTNGQIQFKNVPEARVYGLEMELRTGLDRLYEPLRDFSIGANFTVSRSAIDIPEEELAIRRSVDPEADGTRVLQGQSPYLVNANLMYDNGDSGTSAGVFFNIFGKRLTNVGLGPVPDVYEMPRPSLNLTFSQRVFGEWTIDASVDNLLDVAYEESYNFNGEEYTYQSYDLGRTFSLGISFTP